MKTRELNEEEQEYVEAFLVHAANVVGTILTVPTRVSYSVGDLTMHFYIEVAENK